MTADRLDSAFPLDLEIWTIRPLLVNALPRIRRVNSRDQLYNLKPFHSNTGTRVGPRCYVLVDEGLILAVPDDVSR